MREPWGRVTDLVLALLAEHGPMTQAELREESGAALSSVSRAMQRLITECPMHGQRAHIIRWITTVDEGREYPRPVYVSGPGKNAPKQLQRRRDLLKKKRESWNARKMKRKGVSVFHMALPGREFKL